MKVWQERGAPADKLVMGIASYGRGWSLASTANTGVGAAGNPASLPSTPGKYTAAAGFLSYYEIENMLRTGGTATFDAERDAMYAVKGSDWVGYDNAATVKTKCEFAIKSNYAGAMVWALDLDRFYGARTYPLVRAIKDTFAASVDNGGGTNGGDNGNDGNDADTTVAAGSTSSSTAVAALPT